MHSKLPSLTAIRAFEATARHLSVSQAAAELNVTHAAVSQQIRALEDWLGVKLIKRVGRSIALTESGAMYAAALLNAFEGILDATRQVRAFNDAGPVNVTTTPTFASRWMVPRLNRFRALYPDVIVRISPETELVDLAREDVDLGVRYGSGKWPGLTAERIIGGTLAPVCSPAYLAKAPPLEKPVDLMNHQLIDDSDPDEWSEWLRTMGVDDVQLDSRSFFTIKHLGHQAALEGQGVFLGVVSLMEEDIRAGRLVLPLGPGDEVPLDYYLVTRKDVPLRTPARQFWEWILEEACRPPEEG